MATLGEINVAIGMKLDGFDAGVKQLESGIGRLGDRMQSLGGSLTKYLSAPLALLGGASLKAAADFDSLRRGLSTFEKTAENTEKRLTELKEVAKLPGLGLKEAVQADIRLRAVGISADLAKKAMLAFGNAIATTGGGKAELDRVTVQLGQLSAKGKVLAQDLRPIIEAAPNVAVALKKLYGTVDSADISAILERQGKSSTQFIEILTNELGKLPQVTGGLKNAFENFGDSAFIAFSKLGDGIEKTFNLAENLSKLGDFIVRAAEGFSSLSPAVQGTVVTIGALAVATGPVLFGMGKIVSLIPTMVAGFSALKASVLSVNGALGLAVIALATYAATQAAQLSSQKEANKNFIPDTIKQYAAEYGTLSEKLKAVRYGELNKQLVENVRYINQAQVSLDGYTKRLDALNKLQRFKTPAEFDEAKRLRELIPLQEETISRYRQRKEIAEGTLREIVKLGQAETESTTAAVAGNTDLVDALAKVSKSLRQVEQENIAFGKGYDYVAERAKALENGISTLIEAGFNAQSKAVQKLVGELNTLGQANKSALSGFEPIAFKSPDISFDIASLQEQAKGFDYVTEAINRTVEATDIYGENLSQSLQDQGKKFVDFGRTATNAIVDFAIVSGEALAGLFSGDFNAGSFFSGIMDVVSSFLSQFGKALIAAGVGAIGFKKLLVNPFAAVAAGVALVALAGVVSSIASKGPGGSSGSSGSSASGSTPRASTFSSSILPASTSGVSSNQRSPVANQVGIQGSSGIFVEVGGSFRLQGTDLIAAIENTNKVRQKTAGTNPG